MAQANFGSILDKAASDIRPPEAYPRGEYLCTVQGMPRYDKSTKKGTEFAEYTLIINQNMTADEDEVALVEGGIIGKPIRATFYLTEGSAYRLKEFIEHCGIEIEEGVPLKAYMDQPNGRQVIASVVHEASTDGKRTFAKLGGTAPVSEE